MRATASAFAQFKIRIPRIARLRFCIHSICVKSWMNKFMQRGWIHPSAHRFLQQRGSMGVSLHKLGKIAFAVFHGLEPFVFGRASSAEHPHRHHTEALGHE